MPMKVVMLQMPDVLNPVEYRAASGGTISADARADAHCRAAYRAMVTLCKR